MEQFNNKNDKNFSTKSLDEIPLTKTNHKVGQKYVLYSNIQLDNKLTQVAVSFLEPDMVIENHSHPTMDEYFFILEGEVEFTIEGNICVLGTNMIIEIKSSSKHSLQNRNQSTAKFLYWGVAK